MNLTRSGVKTIAKWDRVCDTPRSMKFFAEPSSQWGLGHTGRTFSGRCFGVPIVGLFLLVAMAFPVAHGHAKDDHDDDYGEEELEVEERRSLRFGRLSSSTDGPGTATVSPTGALSTTGYAIYLRGNPRAAKFQVEGPKNAYVLITLPTSVTFTNGSTYTTLTNFTSDPPAGVAQLNKRGKLTITVGATMNIPTGATRGRYYGSFPIYVDLQ